jgi:hypothetical protein
LVVVVAGALAVVVAGALVFVVAGAWGAMEASTRRVTVVRATAARVSDRDAEASSAACTGVNGGVSLVFTRPG